MPLQSLRRGGQARHRGARIHGVVDSAALWAVHRSSARPVPRGAAASRDSRHADRAPAVRASRRAPRLRHPRLRAATRGRSRLRGADGQGVEPHSAHVTGGVGVACHTQGAGQGGHGALRHAVPGLGAQPRRLARRMSPRTGIRTRVGAHRHLRPARDAHGFPRADRQARAAIRVSNPHARAPPAARARGPSIPPQSPLGDPHAPPAISCVPYA
mmetsp:Transcript_12405/g.31700  ORF Transcript_12405/g.31700 Transcript_12405/m.31700 type:complete len:214 (-) Transcript_12405:538-1179(-)